MAEKNYLVDPDTGDHFRIGGCLISNEPSDLPKFGASRHLSSKHLPRSVDLRQLMTPVEHQGTLNSCVANALAGAYEFLIMKHSKKHIDVSRLFIYYNARSKDGLQEYNMNDNGTYIRSAIAALAESGCCKENSYPYNPSHVDRKPPHHCYVEGVNYRIKKAMNIEVDLDEMKACLAEGYPFTFGLQLFQSFMKAGKHDGRVPMPNPNTESQNSEYGWHSMLAVGYSDPSRCFIVRNSWGEKWGDKGYCYIPYDYMCDPQHCTDLHAIKIVSDDSRHQKHEHISSSYNWNTDKDKKNVIPSDCPEKEFHYKSFWKVHDMFNYFSTIWKDGKESPFSWKKAESEDSEDKHQKILSAKNESPIWFILWIDQKSVDNINAMKQLTNDTDIKIDFCETLSEAENYILKHVDNIKSLKFQIICRGYYKHENKNPLNLLHFLNNHGLNHIPVLVFTRDKSALQYYLQHQAPSMGINDWQQRLFITNNSEKLVKKSKENMINKHNIDHH